MSTKRKKTALEWSTMGAVVCRVDAGDRTLIITIMKLSMTEWYVLAVEMAEAAYTVNAVFADHAHKSLGQFGDLLKAQRAAERYATKWARQRDKEANCACGSIVTQIDADFGLTEALKNPFVDELATMSQGRGNERSRKSSHSPGRKRPSKISR
jgi:hypothetical protein